MPEMIHFPTDPSDPVEVLDIQSPEDLSAFFCDRFEAVHGQGWTAYTRDDQASAPNPRAAAFLAAHAANGRTDWSTSLHALHLCPPTGSVTKRGGHRRRVTPHSHAGRRPAQIGQNAAGRTASSIDKNI